MSLLIFFFNDTATTEIYTLSLHDALPISPHCTKPTRLKPALGPSRVSKASTSAARDPLPITRTRRFSASRSEEHTSELQSLAYLVCRLLLEKKKKTSQQRYTHISLLTHLF